MVVVAMADLMLDLTVAKDDFMMLLPKSQPGENLRLLSISLSSASATRRCGSVDGLRTHPPRLQKPLRKSGLRTGAVTATSAITVSL